MKLRDYQIAGIEQVRAYWADGHRNVVAVAPTGSGKGTMAASLLASEVARGGRGVFVTHLRDIAEDMARRLRALGVRTGMMLPGHPEDRAAKVQIVTVQSLAARKLPRHDLVVVDEAHHYRADEWENLISSLAYKRMVGFTATPQRADGKGLGEVFTALVDVVSYSQLIKRKLIVPCRVLSTSERVDDGIALEPADAYLRYAGGRSAFVFTESVKSGRDTVATLRKAGVKADIVTAATDHDERSASVQGLRDGNVSVIVNVGTMTEGVDVPRVSAIVIAQKLLHDGAYMQRVGRALRAYRGKRHALVIDLAGACYRHGMPGMDREYSLELDRPMAVAGMERMRAANGMRDGMSVTGDDLVEVDAAWLSRRGGPRYVDWSSVDWSRGDSEIGRELGVHSNTVRLHRPPDKPFGRSVKASIIASIDWSSVDWSRTHEEIARDLELHANTVRKRRPANLRFDQLSAISRIASIDWSSVDWSRTDTKLGLELGVSPATVKKRRPTGARVGLAASRDLVASIDWSSVDWSRSDSEIGRELGVSGVTVASRRPPDAISSRLSRWSSVDWSRADSEIGRELGAAPETVRQRRRRARAIATIASPPRI